MIVILIFSFELDGKLNTVEALVNGHPRDTKKVSVNQVNGAGVCFSKALLVTFRARKAVTFVIFVFVFKIKVSIKILL